MDDFETFWIHFPKKVAKGDARKAWAQTQNIRPPLLTLLEAIEEAKKHWTEPKFTPHPATWLRAERWTDEWPQAPLTAQERFLKKMEQEDAKHATH